MGRYQDALDILNQAVQINPYDAYSLYDLGRTYDELGDLDKAREYYQKAVKEYQIDPAKYTDQARLQSWAFENNLGIAQLAQSDFDSALTNFQSLTTKDPKFGQGYYLQGITYTNKSEYPTAVNAFDQSVAPQVEFALKERGYNGKGVALYLDEKPNDAINAYSQSIQEVEKKVSLEQKLEDLNQSFAIAYSNRGLTHFDLGDLEDAETDYQTAIDKDSSDPRTFNNVGYVKYEIAQKSNRIAKAGDPIHALQEFPLNSIAYFRNRIDQYASQLPKPVAEIPALVALMPSDQGWEQLFAPTPQSENPLFSARKITELALTQLAITKLNEAVAAYQQAINLDVDKDFPNPHYGLANAKRIQQDFDSALNEFKQARDLYRQKGDQLWVDFTEQLDIPAVEARLTESILPEDKVGGPAPASVLSPSAPSTLAPTTPPPSPATPAAVPPASGTARNGFLFTKPEVLQLFDSNQLDLLNQEATNDSLDPVTRREAINALRLKRYRPPYPTLQNRLAKGSAGSFKEADRGVRSAILYFLDEVEPPSPPQAQARIPLPPPPRRPVKATAVPVAATIPASQKRVNTGFNPPPPKVVASGCNSSSIVSAAICRIRA
jgi:tetratricopeptide (TPR) repeat protein